MSVRYVVNQLILINMACGGVARVFTESNWRRWRCCKNNHGAARRAPTAAGGLGRYGGIGKIVTPLSLA